MTKFIIFESPYLWSVPNKNGKNYQLAVCYFSGKFLFVKSILNAAQIELSVKRLAHQILENHLRLEDTVLVGIQPRGIFLSDRIVQELKQLLKKADLPYGKLDITFYRDDVRRELKLANHTHIPFNIENKHAIIIDDVLWTGRTVRSALDALIDFGRPASVELCVLIDRRFSREFPIQANYVGRTIDAFASQKVIVHWKENNNVDEVILV